MKTERTTGYTKNEYYELSEKQGLPKRCPILRDCCRAVETRYEMGMNLGGAGLSFDEFLHVKGQRWDPENMIKSVETVSWTFTHDVATFVENACPEVTLFEPDYLPSHFRQSAFGSASWWKESRRFEAEAKHYSECAEFSQYRFQTTQNATQIRRLSHASLRIPERALEDYLITNISALEPGLTLVENQKRIGKWRVDIVAADELGRNVLVELKSKPLSRDNIDRLNGQVSRYYHLLKGDANHWRVFIVVPTGSRDLTDNIYHGLKPWIDSSEVVVFEFDYSLYGQQFVFNRIAFAETDRSST
jgi:hypothetical protein